MLTRRSFLRTSAITLGLAGAPHWLMRMAAQAKNSRKVLVAIFQRGAADGLNVVVPFFEPRYYQVRPSIAIPQPGKPNGGIDLVDVSGDIRGETTNGGVKVGVTGDKWEGPSLEVRTINGGITLSLPASLSAELEARAVNGGINVDFPLTVSGLIGGRREIRGTIGAGGPRIRATATNGGITINKR